MSDYVEERVVEDDDRYVQVSKGVLVARDRTALREYQKQANRQKQKQNRINRLEEDVENLKSDMNDVNGKLDTILSLLTKDTE